jgi:hypothetical protein
VHKKYTPPIDLKRIDPPFSLLVEPNEHPDLSQQKNDELQNPEPAECASQTTSAMQTTPLPAAEIFAIYQGFSSKLGACLHYQNASMKKQFQLHITAASTMRIGISSLIKPLVSSIQLKVFNA